MRILAIRKTVFIGNRYFLFQIIADLVPGIYLKFVSSLYGKRLIGYETTL